MGFKVGIGHNVDIKVKMYQNFGFLSTEFVKIWVLRSGLVIILVLRGKCIRILGF